jgi:hypothetical protein
MVSFDAPASCPHIGLSEEFAAFIRSEQACWKEKVPRVHIIFWVPKSGRPFDPTMHATCA